jgi:hypothetical protein
MTTNQGIFSQFGHDTAESLIALCWRDWRKWRSSTRRSSAPPKGSRRSDAKRLRKQSASPLTSSDVLRLRRLASIPPTFPKSQKENQNG